MTVWLVLVLLEGALVQLLQAEGTDKVFRVKLFKHGRDATTGNGLLTSGTQRASFGMVMSLTVGPASVLEEVSS